MRAFHRYILMAGLAGTLAWIPSLTAQERDRDRDRDQGSEQEAIRFEKAKEAAADRQERIEEHGASEARQHRQKAPMLRHGDTDKQRHGDRAESTRDRKQESPNR